eukprot:TRINITY_DN26936_c0_g1_i2.p1 TRINITY_DN26936_c0_g1~~TRINITY_DN26936_c0_g1_i2.p1  ORF type:complete len:352 (+),score=48.73 TRINITY_DN26936_c0_g1_i2:101-1156(+)
MSLLKFVFAASIAWQGWAVLVHKKKKPKVAVLVVGRVLDATDVRSDPGPGRLLNFMTGDEFSPGLPAYDRASTKEEFYTKQRYSKGTPWESLLQHVVRPLQEDAASVDVFICRDKTEPGDLPASAESLLPRRNVTEVFTFPQQDVVDLLHQCYQRVMTSGYSYYLKVRPDNVYSKDFPALSNFLGDFIFTRVRSANGIQDLTSEHVSWDYCEATCQGGQGTGYMNDNGVIMVPSSLASKVFLSKQELDRRSGSCQLPRDWIQMKNWPESRFTRAILCQGVKTKKLALQAIQVNAYYSYWMKNAFDSCNQNAPAVKQCTKGSVKNQAFPMEDILDKVYPSWTHSHQNQGANS